MGSEPVRNGVACEICPDSIREMPTDWMFLYGVVLPDGCRVDRETYELPGKSQYAIQPC